jgi:hypothetical protein
LLPKRHLHILQSDRCNPQIPIATTTHQAIEKDPTSFDFIDESNTLLYITTLPLVTVEGFTVVTVALFIQQDDIKFLKLKHDAALCRFFSHLHVIAGYNSSTESWRLYFRGQSTTTTLLLHRTIGCAPSLFSYINRKNYTRSIASNDCRSVGTNQGSFTSFG